MLKLKADAIDINLIQIYAPTDDKKKEEMEKFYHQLGCF